MGKYEIMNTMHKPEGKIIILKQIEEFKPFDMGMYDIEEYLDEIKLNCSMFLTLKD